MSGKTYIITDTDFNLQHYSNDESLEHIVETAKEWSKETDDQFYVFEFVGLTEVYTDKTSVFHNRLSGKDM